MTVASYDTREVATAPDPEARLAELARAGGPLRRCLAAVAGRMVARRGWERLGFASAGDYARERLGLSASSLHEWARVDGRLAELPRLEAALVSGFLPWSKVRLLARFATAETEGAWILRAKSVGVRALEREVRAVDRGALETGGLVLDEDGREVEPTERVRITGSSAVCLQWQRVRLYAARVSGEPLAPGAVLEMVTAEALSALPLDAEAQAEMESGRGGGSSGCESREDEVMVDLPPESELEPPARCELPPFLRSLVAGVDEADPFELDSRLRRAVRLEQRLDAEIGPLLRQVTASEYAWKGRFRTLGAYVREHLGMSPRKARALLRVERAADACPELRRAYAEGALSWLQVQVLAPLLLCESACGRPWRAAWVSLAGRITLRRLEEIVEQARVLREVDPEAWARLQHDPGQLLRPPAPRPREPTRAIGGKCVCDPRVAGEGWHLTITAPTEVARLFRALLCTVRRAHERETGRLPSDGEAFQAMLDHALRSWGVDEPWLARKMRRVSPVFERDGWRCTVPGCSSRRNLHAHHIVFRSAGGGDELANLTTLCAVHHQRGVHEGLITVRGRAPHGLTFEIGLRPGLPPLARYRSGDWVA